MRKRKPTAYHDFDNPTMTNRNHGQGKGDDINHGHDALEGDRRRG